MTRKVEIGKEKLRELYVDKRMTIEEIAKLYNVSPTAIRRRLVKYDIPRRPAVDRNLVREKPSKEELEKLYVQMHLSSEEIGQLYGVHKSTVLRWLRSYDIPVRLFRKERQFEDVDLLDMLERVDIKRYKPMPRKNISVCIPIDILNREEKLDCNVALVLSDLHLGHSDFLPDTFYSAVETLKETLKKLTERFNIRTFKVVLNGDIVSGREVYPMQELSNLLPRGHWQVFLAEIVLKELFDELSNIIPIESIYLIKGTHESLSENYILYLKRTLRGNGFNVIYSSKVLILDIGEPIGHYNILITHGKGYSDYYPVPLAMIRDLWKALNQFKLSKIPIERCCLGHTHWLTTNLELEGITIDVTGGFQRWEKTTSQRPSGMLLYLYVNNECSVVPIKPNQEIFSKEIMDPALEYKNIKLYGEKLLKHVKEIDGIDNE